MVAFALSRSALCTALQSLEEPVLRAVGVMGMAISESTFPTVPCATTVLCSPWAHGSWIRSDPIHSRATFT